MIYETLNIVAERLNEYFSLKEYASREMVVLSPLFTTNGDVAVRDIDNIVLTLYNVEEERVVSHGSVSNRGAKVRLNLTVAFSAYFAPGNYEIALRSLSSLVAFFQRERVFTPENTPTLPTAIEKLSFEIVNLNQLQVSNTWGALGGKHMPFICYKIKAVGISDVGPDIPEGIFKGVQTV